MGNAKLTYSWLASPLMELKKAALTSNWSVMAIPAGFTYIAVLLLPNSPNQSFCWYLCGE